MSQIQLALIAALAPIFMILDVQERGLLLRHERGKVMRLVTQERLRRRYLRC